MLFDRPAANPEAFGHLLRPADAIEPILARPVRDALTEWLTEIWSAEELAEVGLKPRQKALFHGGNGTGKTTLAHHLAARLGLTMLDCRSDRIIDKWVGSSAQNVGGLFDVLEGQETPLLLFLDEFDSLGEKRMSSGLNPGAEAHHNQMVNTLLARMEAYSGFIIAATNHPDKIDPAIWRRFDIHIHLALPGPHEVRRILKRYFAPFVLPDAALTAFAESLETATPALIRQVCESLKRQIVLGPKAGWAMEREAVFARIVAAVQPHADAGKPRLWSLGAAADKGVAALPWPFERDLAAYPPEPDPGAPSGKPDKPSQLRVVK
ncbi:MAG: ATP-binding protein [Nitratireductor sp.]|nr:ATP-binding protein [Nitratireductor sp.]